MKKYDAVIIGFGKGGKTLAGKLAGEGKAVALIEKSDKMAVPASMWDVFHPSLW